MLKPEDYVDDWFGEKRRKDEAIKDSPDIFKKKKEKTYKEVVQAEKDEDCLSNWDEESFVASPKESNKNFRTL